MSNAFFIVLIVAIGCTTAVVSNYLKSRANRDERGANLDETLSQLDALEERIRVLERIVTENKFDLKHEIDKL